MGFSLAKKAPPLEKGEEVMALIASRRSHVYTVSSHSFLLFYSRSLPFFSDADVDH